MRNLRYIWDISTVGLCSGNSLKDGFVRATLPNVEKIGRFELCRKGNCHVSDFKCKTDLFSIEALGETFKI